MSLEWTDVTLPVRGGMAVWPGDPEVVVEPVCTWEDDGVRVSRLVLGSHTGTHVDAPSHFLPDGRTVDRIDPWRLVGPCRVLDVRGASPRVRRADLEAFAPRRGERLLLKTGGEANLHSPVFQPSFVALAPEAARYLAEVGVILVGIDALSIEPVDAEEHPAHYALLEQEIVIVEGLDLGGVDPGEWELIVLPLRLEGADGSPARVLLGRPQGVRPR